jgi:hypothetical protein
VGFNLHPIFARDRARDSAAKVTQAMVRQ